MKNPFSANIEPLEARIAPASVIANPLFDITVGVGETGAIIDLAKIADSTATFRTIVEFTTNYTIPGQSSPGVIRLELFDDKTPLTVKNFLSYVNNPDSGNDYVGTYFHELVNGAFLRGGAYNPAPTTNNLGPHIDTPYTVHNEYFASDAELDPVAGTIAMQKVDTSAGGGPNSAASEFFINYDDNSTPLDSKNGGFTVFGKVISGMDVLNSLATLRRVPIDNLAGSGSDGIPTTKVTGAPTDSATASDLIKITAASVISSPADQGNFKFSLAPNAIQKISGDSFLTATLDASNHLKLKYAAGKSGVAKVTVTVTDTKGDVDPFNDTSFTDDFTVTAKPNLVSLVSTSLSATIVPGQKGSVPVVLQNNGGGIAKGAVNVRLFLSEITTSGDPDVASGFTLEETGTNADIEIGNLTKSVSVGSGKSLSLAVPYEISAADSALLKIGSKYRLLAKIETPSGSTLQELFTDDNIGNNSGQSTFKTSFGQIGTQSGVTITVADKTTGGNPITLILKGPGTGDATRNTDGTLDIHLTGTTTATQFSVKTPKGVTSATIGQIHIDNAIGKVTLPNINLESHFAASGGVKSIVLGNLGKDTPTDSSNFSIGGTTNLKTKVVLGEVHDYYFDADLPLQSLTAKAWLDRNANEKETLTFFGLGSLLVSGNFEANIDERGSTAIKSLTLAGTVANSEVATYAGIKKLVAGNVTGSTFALGDSAHVSNLVATKGTASFKSVSDTAFRANYPITTISAAGWVNTAASAVEELTFNGLGTMEITGDLGANVSETSGQPVKSISVSGALSKSAIKTTGDLFSLSATSTDDSIVFVGYDQKPTGLLDLATAGNIGKIVFKNSFSDTLVVAKQIASASVNGVVGASGTGKFGFYADAIKSYVRDGVKKVVDEANPDGVDPNYEVVIF